MSRKHQSEFKPFALYDPTKPLPAIYDKRAAKELKENKEQLSAHLESFKRWIKSMPYLQCTPDDNLLLAFLRHSKYNHLKAQTRLDKFCTFRTNPKEGVPEWFVDTPKRRGFWEKWLDLRCWTPIGVTSNGVLVAMMRMANCDMSEFPLNEWHAAFQLWTDLSVADQRAQIGGGCMIMDMTGMKKETMFQVFDPKISKSMTKYFQECLPYRINKLIYYNMPKFFEGIFKLYTEWLNEKIKSKIMIINGDMSKAFEEVPGLKEIAPKDIGGDCKFTFEEICESNDSILRNIPAIGDEWNIAVDESKRPPECKCSFGTYKDLPKDAMGKTGTYVKLNDEI